MREDPRPLACGGSVGLDVGLSAVCGGGVGGLNIVLGVDRWWRRKAGMKMGGTSASRGCLAQDDTGKVSRLGMVAEGECWERRD